MESISSRKNENVRLMRELFRDKSLRDERGLIAAEGDHLCGELVGAGYETELFAYTESAVRKYPKTAAAMLNSARESVIITEEIAEYISDTKTPQGLFAAAVKRERGIPPTAERIVALNNVQDPGNVGTMIRAAEALGFDGAALVGSCADAFSPKTLRASMGSALRLPIVSCAESELREILRGFVIFGAMLDDTAKRLGETQFPEKTAIVIGSEGAGISPEVAALCDEKIYIPIKGAESLNAATAAAILMWEARKA